METVFYKSKRKIEEEKQEKTAAENLRASKKRKVAKSLQKSFEDLNIDSSSTAEKMDNSNLDVNNNPSSDDSADKSRENAKIETTATRRSTRIQSSRKSIPLDFIPPANPVQSTPAPSNMTKKTKTTDNVFCSPLPAHHYGENTVIRIDGTIASFNQTGDFFDASAKRVQLLDSQLDDRMVRNNVKRRLDLSTIEEERCAQEYDDEKDQTESVVFTSKCGDKPVTSMIEVLEKNSTIAVTTTVGGADPSQRSAVVDVLDIDDGGKIQVFRKFMAADNWKNLTDDEKQELLNGENLIIYAYKILKILLLKI